MAADVEGGLVQVGDMLFTAWVNHAAEKLGFHVWTVTRETRAFWYATCPTRGGCGEVKIRKGDRLRMDYDPLYRSIEEACSALEADAADEVRKHHKYLESAEKREARTLAACAVARQEAEALAASEEAPAND